MAGFFFQFVIVHFSYWQILTKTSDFYKPSFSLSTLSSRSIMQQIYFLHKIWMYAPHPTRGRLRSSWSRCDRSLRSRPSQPDTQSRMKISDLKNLCTVSWSAPTNTASKRWICEKVERHGNKMKAFHHKYSVFLSLTLQWLSGNLCQQLTSYLRCLSLHPKMMS